MRTKCAHADCSLAIIHLLGTGIKRHCKRGEKSVTKSNHKQNEAVRIYWCFPSDVGRCNGEWAGVEGRGREGGN